MYLKWVQTCNESYNILLVLSAYELLSKYNYNVKTDIFQNMIDALLLY